MSAKTYLINERDRKVKTADELVKSAEKRNGSLTESESAEVKSLLSDVGFIQQKLDELHDQNLRHNGREDEIPTERLAKYREEESFRKTLARKFGPGAGSTASLALAVESAQFDRKRNPAVIVPMSAALKASTFPSAETYNIAQSGTVAAEAADRRRLYPSIPTVNVTDETAISDFIASARTVTGDVERDLDAVTDKAVLELDIDAVSPELRQVAVTLKDIPNVILDDLRGARQLFNSELRLAIESAVDAHTYGAITTAAATGGGGADLVAAIRNGIAQMRDDGFDPNVLVVDSDTGALLDLSQHGTNEYLFAPRATGTASPLWSVRIVEVAAAATQAPLLIDTSAIGTLYLGSVAIAADPYSGFTKNLTTLRAEGKVLMHVRRPAAALFVDES